MVTGIIREIEEENRNTKMVQKAKQGACNRWDVSVKQLSHREILETLTESLKFLFKSVYDLLLLLRTRTFGLVRRKSVCFVEGGPT